MEEEPMVDTEFFSRISIFEKLPEETLQMVAALWKPLTREAGQLIFRKGEPSQAMYVVRRGKIGITVWTEDNEEVTLAVLHEGDFFGELGLFDGSPRTANAKAIERVDLLEMKRDVFIDFLKQHPEVSLHIASIIAQRLRQTNALVEQRAAKNANVIMDQRLTFGQRIADKMAEFGGSWTFIFSFLGFMALWTGLNTFQLWFKPFDEYPFILLNLMLSTIAAIQGPIIMMSQNRQAAKDRLQAELEYQVNLKAEMQIQGVHTKLDELRATELQELVELQREQIELLRKQLKLLEAQK
jgi:uncharacterized membrane protein